MTPHTAPGQPQLVDLIAQINQAKRQVELEQNAKLLLQSAFNDLKLKNQNLEKVVLSYHLSLQNQKSVELSLM